MSSEQDGEKITERRITANQVRPTGLRCHHNYGVGSRCNQPLMSSSHDWQGTLTCAVGHRFAGPIVMSLVEAGRWR